MWMKKIVIMGIFFCIFLTGMDRLKNSFPKSKDSPKGSPKGLSKQQKLSGSDGNASSSPKRHVTSIDELKGEWEKTKEEKKQLEENK
jgi:hypothetical protein